MIEDHLKPDNHTLIELPLIHVESCALLMSFVQHHFNINKQDQAFKGIDNEISTLLILSNKSCNPPEKLAECFQSGTKRTVISSTLKKSTPHAAFEEPYSNSQVKNYI